MVLLKDDYIDFVGGSSIVPYTGKKKFSVIQYAKSIGKRSEGLSLLRYNMTRMIVALWKCSVLFSLSISQCNFSLGTH